MKVLITGGHPTPAFAVIYEMQKKVPSLTIIYVGKKYILDSERSLSYEYKECQIKKIRFIELNAGRLTRLFTRSSLIGIVKIPIGFFRAFFIIIREKPDIIMSFGGYIALPLVIWGWVFQKKIYTHEQTIRPGLANKIIGLFASTIFVSFQSSVSFFPVKKTVWTGNPIRRSIYVHNDLPFDMDKKKPVLYITGGTLGSHSINKLVFPLIKKLALRFTVIHQIGNVKQYCDWDIAYAIKEKLPYHLQKRYYPFPFIEESQIGSVYHKTSLVVGRAGANTFFELIALRKPAILIPLPWSAYGEQKEHAFFFARHKLGEYFDQNDSSDNLYKLIITVMSSLASYRSHFDSLPLVLKQDASQAIVQTICK